MKRYITCQITSEGYVAIWWYDDEQDKMIYQKCLVSEGEEHNGYIEYPNYTKSKFYNKVVFNIKTQCYQIICSSAIASDKKVIKLIAEECNLSDKQVMIVPDVHYDNNAVDMLELFTE